MLQKCTLVSGVRWVAFALALTLLGSEPARASFILGGNTQPEFTTVGSVHGYINFAVYGLGGGAAGDSYGTGVTGADFYLAQAGFFSLTPGATPGAPATLPNYVYFFQVLNASTTVGGVAAPPISSTTVSTAGTIGGFGTLSGPLPGGGGGVPIPSGVGIGASYLGTPLSGGDPGTAVTFGPTGAAGNGPAPASLTSVAPGVNLAVVATNGATSQLTPTSLQENFAPFGSILAGGLSYVFGYTTNLPPLLTTTGSLQDHGTSAVGTIPLPSPAPTVPEPSTIVMVATALPLALVYLRRRTRSTLAS